MNSELAASTNWMGQRLIFRHVCPIQLMFAGSLLFCLCCIKSSCSFFYMQHSLTLTGLWSESHWISPLMSDVWKTQCSIVKQIHNVVMAGFSVREHAVQIFTYLCSSWLSVVRLVSCRNAWTWRTSCWASSVRPRPLWSDSRPWSASSSEIRWSRSPWRPPQPPPQPPHSCLCPGSSPPAAVAGQTRPPPPQLPLWALVRYCRRVCLSPKATTDHTAGHQRSHAIKTTRRQREERRSVSF